MYYIDKAKAFNAITSSLLSQLFSSFQPQKAVATTVVRVAAVFWFYNGF